MPARSVLFTFTQYSIAICTRPEADSGIISGVFLRVIALDKAVKLCDLRLNRYREISSTVIVGAIFDSFRDNCRPKVACGVLSDVAVDYFGVKCV